MLGMKGMYLPDSGPKTSTDSGHKNFLKHTQDTGYAKRVDEGTLADISDDVLYVDAKKRKHVKDVDENTACSHAELPAVS